MIKFYNSLKIITCIFLLSFGVGSAFGQTVIASQDFDGASPTWSYTNDIPFFDNGGDGFYGVTDISNYSNFTNSSFESNLLVENDLDDEGDNGTTGFATVSFGSIDVSNFVNVEITFDYEVIGYNATNDDAKYQVYFDGVGQGDVLIVDGGVDPTDASGSTTILVPNGTSAVELDIAVRNNGGSGYSAFDNFKITGNSSTDVTAPTFENSTPTVGNVTNTSGDLTVDIDEGGTVYYIVEETPSSNPSAAQVKAGNDGAGSAAFLSNTMNVADDGVHSFIETISGLTTSTEYIVHVVAEDFAATPNLMASPGSVTFTAQDVTPPSFVSAATTSASTSNDIVLTLSEAITTTDETGFSIEINSVGATITGVTGSGSDQLTFTIAEEIDKPDVVTISYDNTSGDVQDGGSNALPSFTDNDVTNNATTTIVADITAARALSGGESVRISGEVIVTYLTGNFRDQIFIQDNNAGILIDDDSPVISTAYNVGDGITNFQGTLSAFGGVTQIVPDQDPGAASTTGNTVSTTSVTISDFNASIDTYESRLIEISEITFVEANGSNTFSTNSNTDITDGTNTIKFNASTSGFDFPNIDYSGEVIPYGRLDIIGLAREDNGTAEITARSTADIQDNYAPLFVSAPATSNVTTNSFDVTFQADEPGTYYYVVDQNATAPDAATVISTGTSLAYTDVAADVTFNVSGLNDNTQYYVHTVLADDETTPNEQAIATTTTVTTLEIVFDADSDITDPVTQVAAGTVSSLVNDAGSAVDVFTFTLSDLGTADGEPTLVNTIVIEKGTNNTVADWSTIIAGAEISGIDPATTSTTINSDNITFDLSSNEYSIADGTSVELTLSIYLTTSVVDEEVLAFEIPITHGFQANVAGSIFVTDLAAVVTSNDQTIDVDATTLDITAPSTAEVNTDFTVSYSAVDANGNIDLLPRTMDISLASGTGTLSSVTGLTQDVFDGTFTWADLQYDVVEDITLLVDDQGSALSTTTGTITVTSAASGTLFFSEYIEGSSNNKALEIFNATGLEVNLSEYRILRDNNGTTDATDTLELSTISATLPAEGILVIANPSADAAILSIADITSEITFYNGDDALRLIKGDVVIDQIGELGVDPGSSWDVAGGTVVTDGGATAEFTLVRKSDVTEGNPTALASFGTNPTDSEWIVLAQDDFSNLGVFDGASSVPPSMIVNTSAFNGNFGFVEFGTDSDLRSYSVEGSNLTDDISITPPVGFEVATTTDFSSTVGTNASPLILTQSAGAVASTEIFVRFVPDAADGTTDSGDIVHSSTGAADRSVAVEGTEGAATITEILTARGLAIDTEVTVQGIVTTPDFGFNNDQYFIQDATAGINIFFSTDQGVNIGDEVQITGNIDAFGDQVQISATIVTVLSTGNALPEAQSITTADLSVTSDLQGSRVTITGVTLVDETQWPTEAISTSSGVTVDATVDATSFGIRIDRGESFYDGSPVPAQPFVLTGILSRFNTDVQIMPFVDGDIAEEAAGPGITVDQTGFNDAFGAVQVNTNSLVSSYIVSASGLIEDLTLTVAGEFEVSLTEDFSASVGNASTPLPIGNTQGDVEPTLVYVRFSPTVAGAATGSITHSSAGVDSQVINLSGEGTEDEVTSIEPSGIKQGIKLFPNPVNNGNLTIELSEELGEVEVKLITLAGSALQTETTVGTTTLKVSGLKSGVYMLQLSNEYFNQNYRVILK